MLQQNAKPLLDMPILLVEDNPVNVLVAKMYLQKWGAKVDVATNGLEALETYNSLVHKVVLMDLQMPVMDGFESAGITRERGIDIPIIAFTAEATPQIVKQTRTVGIDDVVSKPFDPEHLQNKILHHLNLYKNTYSSRY